MSKIKVTFNCNVKLGADPYRKGEQVVVTENIFESLENVIEAKYERVEKVSKPIDEMTIPELKEYAAENNIDLGDAKKRDDILEVIQKN